MKRKQRLAYYIHPESDCAFVGLPGAEGDGCLMQVGETYTPSQKEFEYCLIKLGAKPPFYKLDLTKIYGRI